MPTADGISVRSAWAAAFYQYISPKMTWRANCLWASVLRNGPSGSAKQAPPPCQMARMTEPCGPCRMAGGLLSECFTNHLNMLLNADGTGISNSMRSRVTGWKKQST